MLANLEILGVVIVLGAVVLGIVGAAVYAMNKAVDQADA